MMSSGMVTFLLWIAALGSGLMTGVYFAFSGFIMKAFSKIETSHAIAAMNAINETVLRSSFLLLFFGSSIISVLLVIVAINDWGESRAILALSAGLVYFFGMFICTIAFNVPLNNSLAKIEYGSGNAQQVWLHYLSNWTSWNHLRTVSSLITCVLSIWLLVDH